MFLSFQLLEKGFEQPRMTGWGNNAVLARLVDALDKRTGQTELDELEPSPLLCLIIRGNGATLVDQDFDRRTVFAEASGCTRTSRSGPR